MRLILKTRPAYFFLLSVFFVLHGYTENFDFIPVKDALLLELVYLLASCSIGGFFWIIYKNSSKALLISFLLMSFYFFFGYIYDNLYVISSKGFFSKYSVIIGLFSIGLLALFIYLLRYKGSLKQLNHVLNVFFLCLLIVDSAWLVAKILNRKKPFTTPFAKSFTVCDTCFRPDIYLIVADNYAGDRQLKETMNFDNLEFKEQLHHMGFYTPFSISNYNFTPFSVASMLEMEYLNNITGKFSDHNDLSICYGKIRENHAFEFLNAYGYKMYNYSIFDIHDQPSVLESSVLPERTRFITAQTLFKRLEKNIQLNMRNALGTGFKRKHLFSTLNSNVRAIDSLKTLLNRKPDVPRFVYTHLVMPHFPYYFTKTGGRRPMPEIEDGQQNNIARYLEYLQYTNGVLVDLIRLIWKANTRPFIIILVSDHGFRDYPFGVKTDYYFMNQLCIYLPHHNYQPFYDGISNVNLFRVLFNTEFNQRFPLLPDSTHLIDP